MHHGNHFIPYRLPLILMCFSAALSSWVKHHNAFKVGVKTDIVAKISHNHSIL